MASEAPASTPTIQAPAAASTSPMADKRRLSSNGPSPIGSEREVSPNPPAKASEEMTASGTLESGTADEAVIKAQIERKRLEHEHQRALQRQAFEEQMRALEQQQREEEATILQQQQQQPGSGGPSPPASAALNAPGLRSQFDGARAPGPYHPSQPGQFGTAYRSNNGLSPSRLGSGLLDTEDTQDGLNGSNVPGLAPLNRTSPESRRSSRDPAGAASLNGARTTSAATSQADLVSSLGRLGIAGNSSAPGSGPVTPQRAHPGNLQRLISRSGGPGDFGQEGTGSGMTPLFNERFLFDDELDAEDSAFVKKYNLSEDDDKFPVLLRNDNFPKMSGQLSTASAALDLAPLSQMESRHPRGPSDVMGMSEWPQFDPTRRGRSERNSPTPRGAPNGQGRNPQLPYGASQTNNSLNRHSLGPAASVAARFPGGQNPAAAGFATPNNGSLGSGTDQQGRAPYSGFGADGTKARLGAYPGGPLGDEQVARSRPDSGYFQAFSNGPASRPGGPADPSAGPFGFGSEEDLAASDLAAGRKGELDINTRLEDLKGQIFTLCKDQHGCRFLQKKLEEGVAAYRDMIFTETFSHFAELMTDPFGNYLCQKMLEHCTDNQRDLIVESVASELVTISLNMHGTRAVQKTIDFLSTPSQIRSIIVALSMNVVTLIKDLNGNHVIQKCLNRLGAEDNQFIYNAVAQHCVEVATHRHGCCVLQRCVDHASDTQRMQLVHEITFNALTLVQDPFGNYVVQYILDLNDQRFTDAVVRQFIGNVCLLSVQKFSSNVIEKCIRVSDVSVRRQLVEEFLNRARLEKLLRDSFANYVVQTALDYSEPVQRAQLVECIRPILPMIRNTPYGKRIQSKLHRDNFDPSGAGAGGAGPMSMGGPGGMNVPYHLMQHQQSYSGMPTGPANAGRGGGMGYQQGYNAYGNNASMNASPALPAPHQMYGGGAPRGGGNGGGGGGRYSRGGYNSNGGAGSYGSGGPGAAGGGYGRGSRSGPGLPPPHLLNQHQQTRGMGGFGGSQMTYAQQQPSNF